MRGISPISGQVVFGLRQVTFLASLPNGQGNGQAATFNGFKKACEKEINSFLCHCSYNEQNILGWLSKQSLTRVLKNRVLSHFQFLAQRFYLSTICCEQFQ